MKGLFEAVLNLEVTNNTEKAYKRALERGNKRYSIKHMLRDGSGHIVKDEPESVWSDNYCHVDTLYSIPARKSKLTISIVSRTLQNVKDAVTGYQMLGAELVRKNQE